MRREGRHHDRAEAQQAGLRDRLARRQARRARAWSAKSIIMIAFFLTMPISRMMPISAMIGELDVEQHQRQHRADAGRRQGREDRDRVDVALVENAEHDVDGEERGGDQQRHAWPATAGRSPRCPRSRRGWSRACRCAASPSSIARLRLAQRMAGREVERDRRGGELALVVDASGVWPRLKMREGRRAAPSSRCAVDTAAPVEALRWPLAASELVARLRAESAAIDAAELARRRGGRSRPAHGVGLLHAGRIGARRRDIDVVSVADPASSAARPPSRRGTG